MKRYLPQAPDTTETASLLCVAFSFSMIAMAFCVDTPAAILQGWGRIFTSRAVLLSDYFVIGGYGAAFLNAGVVMLMSMLLVRLTHTPLSGIMVAALFLMPGFALFGKNPFNILPFVLGVAIYCRYRKVPLRKHVGAALYSTTLCPVVNELLLMTSLPLPLRLMCAVLAGMAIGFIIVPFAEHMLNVHRGYILFNYGFASGFIAYLIMALTRAMGATVQSASDWMPGRNAAVRAYLLILCISLIVLGLWISGWNFKRLLLVFKVNGCPPNNDMFHSVGIGCTMVNMGTIGLICFAYIHLSGGDLSGPAVGGIFTAIGFAAAGVQPRNFLPILLGIWLFSCFGAFPANAHNVQLAAIFGSVALAPIAGEYGVLAGMGAGFLHYALISVTGANTGGLNLYNNGFAAGIVATIMVTLLDTFSVKGALRTAFIRRQRRGSPPESGAASESTDDSVSYDEF